MAQTRSDLKMVSFRLTLEARTLLLDLGRYHGQHQTAIVERLLREHGREVGLFPPVAAPVEPVSAGVAG